MGIIIILITLLIASQVYSREKKTLKAMRQVFEHTDKIQNHKWSVTVKGSAIQASVTKPICFTIPSYSKSKKDAYDLLQKRMRKFRKFLRTQFMICDSSQSVQSMTKQLYLNKKKVWLFEKTAIVLAEPQFVQYKLQYLRKMAVFQVQCQQKFRVNQKKLRKQLLILKALQNAKDQLRELIAQYPFLQVDEIEYCSIEYVEKWKIPFDQNIIKLQSYEDSNYQNEKEYQNDNVQMEVVFQIKYDDDQQKIGLYQTGQDQQL